MNIVLPNQAIVASPMSRNGWRFMLRRGVLFTPNCDAKFWSMVSWSPFLGVVAIVVHPTIASFFGPSASKVFAAFAILLLLPSCRRIVLAPAVAIALACLFIGVYTRSVTAMIVAVPAYAVFYLMAYEFKRFYWTVLVIAALAGALALLQFLIPSPLLNIHATASSANRLLDQYRPTSIFPSQAYYNQLLLLLVPLFFMAKERRALLLAAVGFSAAITGATAGLLFVVLSFFLGIRRVGFYVLAGFLIAIVLTAVFYRDRLVYNFSLRDQVLSVSSRIHGESREFSEMDAVLARGDASRTVRAVAAAVASGTPIEAVKAIGEAIAAGDSAEMIAAAVTASGPSGVAKAAGHPSLLIAAEFLAVAGLSLVAMMAVRMSIPLSSLVPFSAAALAILCGQLIHGTIGSLYFSLTLAVLIALIWNFIFTFIELTKDLLEKKFAK